MFSKKPTTVKEVYDNAVEDLEVIRQNNQQRTEEEREAIRSAESRLKVHNEEVDNAIKVIDSFSKLFGIK